MAMIFFARRAAVFPDWGSGLLCVAVGVVASLAMLIVRAPTLVPLENPVMRVFSGLTFYLLLPMAMIFIAWKAAPFSDRGTGLFCAAAGLFACHALLMDRAPTVVPLKNPLMRILTVMA
jgi:hypothetical protein